MPARHDPIRRSPRAPDQEKEIKMNGLMKNSKLETLHFAASFAIAFFSVAAVLYVMATAITGLGVA
jgi:hypothetical protein